MKHLKRFNESVDMIALNKILELKEFTEGCLAYLLDEGLEVYVEKAYMEEGIYEISLHSGTSFNWIKIKDYYIPFIQLLSKRYEFVQQYHLRLGGKIGKISDNYSGYFYLTYDDIISDKVYKNRRIDSIMIRVKEK